MRSGRSFGCAAAGRVNQMTALSVAHSGKPNPRKPDRFFAIDLCTQFD